MGRLDYRIYRTLAAALCTVSACAAPSPHAQQPPGTAYYTPPAADYGSPPGPAVSQSRSGQSTDRSSSQSNDAAVPDEEPEEGAQASPPDTQREEPKAPDSSSSGDSAQPVPHHVPRHLAAAGPGVSAGMPVQSETGSPLGFVVDVLPGAGGTEESGWVVIVGGSEATTPVPYGAARSMVQNGAVVIDHARFASAPKVKQSQIEDTAKAGWKAQANSYWGSSGSAHSSGPQSQDRPEVQEQQQEEQEDEQPPRTDPGANPTSATSPDPDLDAPPPPRPD